MLAYFAPDNQWSLCDMACKYVVYDPTKNEYFMQDAFALAETAVPTTSATYDVFNFCPACFLESKDLQSATMYHHITTAHQLSLPVIPQAPALVEEDAPSDGHSPRSVNSSNASGSNGSRATSHVTAESFDPDQRSQEQRNKQKQDMEQIAVLMQLLKDQKYDQALREPLSEDVLAARNCDTL